MLRVKKMTKIQQKKYLATLYLTNNRPAFNEPTVTRPSPRAKKYI